jgi:formylglycine-generating enzyme required for sulfatase activity
MIPMRPPVHHRLLRCLLALCLACSGAAAWASNVLLSQPRREPGDALSVEVAWEHAWHFGESQAPANHDAVWLFAKIRIADGPWEPLLLQTANAATAQLQPEVGSDQLGLFLRPAPGILGSIGPLRVTLQPAQALPVDAYEVRFFAIEMVAIPGGGFWLGDGASHNSFASPDGQPFWLDAEEELPAGLLSDSAQYAPVGAIPALYPKGVAPFYCMKYEVSQAQYADFLNTLSYAQQASRTTASPAAAPGTLALSSGPAQRNGIRLHTSGMADHKPAVYGLDLDGSVFNADNDGQHRSCNFLSWDDLSAYLDWAGLRPMTELEFEKVCRGPQAPLPGEFAWGDSVVIDANTVREDGHATEHVTERGDAQVGLASHGYDGPQGPLRCGFAADNSTGRTAAGAGYYGCMELSGNVWEQCVTVNAQGLAFAGGWGDGRLDDQGRADQPTWPGADGAGFRGGGWNSGVIPGFRDLATSDRFYAGLASTARRGTAGGRGCR